MKKGGREALDASRPPCFFMSLRLPNRIPFHPAAELPRLYVTKLSLRHPLPLLVTQLSIRLLLPVPVTNLSIRHPLPLLVTNLSIRRPLPLLALVRAGTGFTRLISTPFNPGNADREDRAG